MTRKEHFVKMRILILYMLKEREYYGYELYEAINKLPDVEEKIKYGRIFPILYVMVNSGYLSSEKKKVNGFTKVYYSITESGIKYYEQLLKDNQEKFGDIDEIINYGDE